MNTLCFASRINPAHDSAPRHAAAFLEEKHLDTLCQFGILSPSAFRDVAGGDAARLCGGEAIEK